MTEKPSDTSECPTAGDLDPDTPVHHAGRQGGKYTVLHTDEKCRHAERSHSLFHSQAGVHDPDRAVCRECLDCVEFGNPSGFNVNETRERLSELAPEDLGLSPIGGRR